MCGQAGVFDPRGALGEAERDRLAAVNADLAHRGPDDQGLAGDARCLLAHRRLAVLDLGPTAAQPMAHPSGALLVYNGEVYNAPALRAELEREGAVFRGHGDTEVVLAACAAWGVPRALDRLEGMFALGLWDPREQALWLARDRAGIKPLYVGRDDAGRTWFGSELGPLARHVLPPRIDRAALGAYAALGFVPGPATIYAAARALAPGHWLRVDARGERTGAFAPRPAPAVPPWSDAPGALRDLLAAATARQLVADVPLGAFLSGGLDSSILCAVVTRLLGRPLHAFSIGYEGERVIDETAWAERVARHLGLAHTVFRVQADDVREVVPRVLAGMGQPFADPSLVPTWLVSRMARGAITVALSGDGADELFAGYRKYDVERRRARFLRLPRAARTLAGAVAGRLPVHRRSRAGEAVRHARKFLDAAERPAPDRWLALQATLRPAERALGWLTPGLADLAALRRRLDEDFAGRGDGLPAMLEQDRRVTLPDRMLFKVDAASMAHGLEVRVPFLDEAVVDFARACPPGYLVDGARKRVLRAAGLPLLPPGFERRPKQGFDLPLGRWFRGPLRPVLLDLVRAERARDLVDAEAVEALLAAHDRGREAAESALWAAFCLASWAREMPFSLA